MGDQVDYFQKQIICALYQNIAPGISLTSSLVQHPTWTEILTTAGTFVPVKTVNACIALAG